MSINSRKKRQKEELRQKILDAAERLFAENGYENVSMRKISAVIEYSPTTIYRFFKNKNELLQTLTVETYLEISARFEKIKSESSLDALAVLKSLIKEYLQFCLGNPNMYELYVNHCKLEMGERSMYETIGGTRYRVFQSWYDLIEQCVRSEKLHCHDVTVILLHIWNATHGFIWHRIKQPHLPWKSDEEEINFLLNMIFYGLEKQGTRIS